MIREWETSITHFDYHHIFEQKKIKILIFTSLKS